MTDRKEDPTFSGACLVSAISTFVIIPNLPQKLNLALFNEVLLPPTFFKITKFLPDATDYIKEQARIF